MPSKVCAGFFSAIAPAKVAYSPGAGNTFAQFLRDIYKTGELEEKPTCAIFAQVREEGRRKVVRQIPYYNLDMIISVGYRVNSIRGTLFRIWANCILKEYLVKGYAINKDIMT